jgi:hypothetical protein
MKTLILLITTLVSAVIPCVQAIAQSDSSAKKLPSAKWQRARTLDMKHIALDLRFDWKTDSVNYWWLALDYRKKQIV